MFRPTVNKKAQESSCWLPQCVRRVTTLFTRKPNEQHSHFIHSEVRGHALRSLILRPRVAAHLESRVRAGCRVVASSGLAIADFLVIMLGGFTAKRCRTCGLLKFGRQGPGEDVCRCCACVSTTCSHTPGNCLQRIKTHGAHRCPSCLKVYGIKRRERLRGNLSAILNIDGQLHPMLMNTNDVDEHRDTATCVADLIPSGAMLAWVVLFHDWIWLWDSHALSWRLLKLQPC